ncbi:MAG: F0F1 ATP synthase subunit A [Gammaproteobacteria bacterium]|nr:F0F1 ATP synthase subunit A [Gammaproteobacteria bacterium]
METGALTQKTLLDLGFISISQSLLTSLVLSIFLTVLAIILTRNLSLTPTGIQSAVEGVVGVIEKAIAEVLPQYYREVMPFIASLWLFLIFANLIGLIPGLQSPTRDLSVTSALAIIVFFSVHWFGIRSQGLKSYLQHYLKPNPLLLPFHIISEITRTVALAVRLFGNIMSLEIAALLVLMVAGFLAPIPILMLHIIEALVQAYIFGMLALVYVAGSIQAQVIKQQRSDHV